VVLSHLGPGLTNAATGVANAALDSIPMVVIAATSSRTFYGRHPHQEVNLHNDASQVEIYRPFCKRVYRVDRAEILPRILESAFHLCQSGRPGPVLVDVPMDIFSADLPGRRVSEDAGHAARPTLDPATARTIVQALATAQRPVLYAGGGVLAARATASWRRWLKRWKCLWLIRLWARVACTSGIRCCWARQDSGVCRSRTMRAAMPT
jgi:acetolactate synthase-1/2/3 large subunit